MTAYSTPTPSWNLAVDDDGAVIFYDFGMAGRVDPFIQEKIVDFYVAVARQDIDGILDTLIAMGTLSPEADREVMGNVMELAIADASGEDIEQYQVNQIIEQVESTIYEFPSDSRRTSRSCCASPPSSRGLCHPRSRVRLHLDRDGVSQRRGVLRADRPKPRRGRRTTGPENG